MLGPKKSCYFSKEFVDPSKLTKNIKPRYLAYLYVLTFCCHDSGALVGNLLPEEVRS